MIIYEETNNYVSGAFLKCFSIYSANEISFKPLGYYSPLLLMALHYCQNITHLLFKDTPLAPLKEMDLARQVEAEMIL